MFVSTNTYSQQKFFNKKILLTALALLTFFVAIVTIFSTAISVARTPQRVQHIYIALGDSISSGFGLDGYTATSDRSHPSIFFEMLNRRNYVDEYHNMARSGYTTTDVLNQLSEMSDDEKTLFRYARVITLNIGGNNIMLPLSEYLSELQIFSGADNFRSGAGGVVDGGWDTLIGIIAGLESFAGSRETSSGVGGIMRGFGGLIAGVGELITGTGEVIGGTPDIASILRGEFPPELEASLIDGIETFAVDFSEIIAWLQNYAPNATIIVNTIFNPIPDEMLNMPLPISGRADLLIDEMNEIILYESEAMGFLVSDVHAYLSGRQDLTAFNINPLEGAISFDLIHPNAYGHMIIAILNHNTLHPIKPANN